MRPRSKCAISILICCLGAICLIIVLEPPRSDPSIPRRDIDSIAFDRRAINLYFADGSNVVWVINLRSDKIEKKSGILEQARWIACSPSEDKLVVTDSHGGVAVLQPQDWSVLKSVPPDSRQRACYAGVGFSRIKNAFFTGQSNRILTWDGLECIIRSSTNTACDKIVAASIDAAGERVAVSCEDRSIEIWDLARGTVLHRLTSRALCLDFDESSEMLASVGDGKVVRFWNLDTGMLNVERSLDAPAAVVKFKPNSTRLACAGPAGIITIMDSANANDIITLRDHRHYVVAIGFSSDGRLMASADIDRNVIVWDTASWEKRKVYKVAAD